MKGIFSNVKRRVIKEAEARSGRSLTSDRHSRAKHQGEQKESENGGERRRTSAPLSELDMPKRERSSSVQTRKSSEKKAKAPDPRLKELPELKDTPPAKREALFLQKLQLCSVIFDHREGSGEDTHAMDMKFQTLDEINIFTETPAGQKLFSEAAMPDITRMITANIFRALPAINEAFDPEEDEPVLEPSWPHLQIVYEFFLKFIVSSETNAKVAKQYINHDVCQKLIDLFDSEDPRERDMLKTILHRIYGKFMTLRVFIRRSISDVFYRFVYETERHNGIAELLEIMGSIINGFAKPLKPEHVAFLKKALLPLHKPRTLRLYSQQLTYCVSQFAGKDPNLIVPIMAALYRYWPWTSSTKQLLLLSEVEELLEMIPAGEVQEEVAPIVIKLLGRCAASQHFQVVERTLIMWDNEALAKEGILSMQDARNMLPEVLISLKANGAGHWSPPVEGLSQNLLSMYASHDPHQFERINAEVLQAEEDRRKAREEADKRWEELERLQASLHNEKESETRPETHL